jgi:phosphoribosylamine--glycine ligase
VLYGGLMLTARGPMVIEWNCRFGDPETQAVLMRLEGDLVPWLVAAARGALPAEAPRWKPGLSLCVVLAGEGYPGKVRTGDRIEGLGSDGQLPDPEVKVFHAGTSAGAGGFLTAGGRVLGVSAAGKDLDEARARVYGAVAQVRWPGQHFRRDIGLRGNS